MCKSRMSLAEIARYVTGTLPTYESETAYELEHTCCFLRAVDSRLGGLSTECY